MTDFNEIANTPIEIEIAGRKLKARRPNLETINGQLESLVISKTIASFKQAADDYNLEGEDRLKFLSETARNIPRGSDLQKMAREGLASIEGTRLLVKAALIKDQPEITDDEVIQLVLSDPEGAAEWMMYLTGDRKKKPKMKT